MNAYLLVAAAISAVTCLIHVVVGGRYVARPLLDEPALRRAPKLTFYYCWHLVTLLLAGMALAFAMAAQPMGSRELAWFATVGAGLCGAGSLVMAVRFGRRLWHFPQWMLFLPIVVLGSAGLLT